MSKVTSISLAADLLGVSRAHAYRQAHKPDANGDLWLIPGKVRIIRIGATLRVPVAQLDSVLSVIEVAS